MIMKPIRRRMILGSIVIILMLWAGIGFLHYRESVLAPDILTVTIENKSMVRTGDEVTYTVHYKNNSNFLLEKAKLTFVFPEHTFTEDSKLRIEKNLNDIAPYGEGVETFSGYVVGNEQEVLLAHAYIAYIPRGLSARYEVETEATTIISEVPIVVTITGPSTVISQQPVSYTLYYRSAVQYPLENLRVRFEKPAEFMVTSARPSSINNTEWKIPTLLNNEEGSIIVDGYFSTGNSLPLPLKVRLGIWQNGKFNTLKESVIEVVVPPQITFSNTSALE